MPKIVHFDEFFKKLTFLLNCVTRQVNLKGQKLVENAKIKKKLNATFSVIFTENSDFWRESSSIFMFEIQREILMKSLL